MIQMTGLLILIFLFNGLTVHRTILDHSLQDRLHLDLNHLLTANNLSRQLDLNLLRDCHRRSLLSRQADLLDHRQLLRQLQLSQQALRGLTSATTT